MGSVPNTGILPFLKNFGSPFGPPDTSDAVRFIRMRTDSLGRQHFEYQQTCLPKMPYQPPLASATARTSGLARPLRAKLCQIWIGTHQKMP
jgi:hypothetical protein